MQCLAEPDLFRFLATLDWATINMVAERSVTFVLENGNAFRWAYDPSGTWWCFDRALSSGKGA